MLHLPSYSFLWIIYWLICPMQWRTPQSGIPVVVNEFNLGSLSNETLTSNKKNFCYTHANKITVFPPFPMRPSSKRQTLSRLRVVPHFFSGIVRRAKRERTLLPTACRLFSRGVIFTRACVSLALLSLRKNGGLLVV